jgi:hypothetical protein
MQFDDLKDSIKDIIINTIKNGDVDTPLHDVLKQKMQQRIADYNTANPKQQEQHSE